MAVRTTPPDVTIQFSLSKLKVSAVDAVQKPWPVKAPDRVAGGPFVCEPPLAPIGLDARL